MKRKSLRHLGGNIRDRDITRARLAAIVESSDDAIVSKTLDGVINSWNRGAERIFGYSAAEAIGEQIFLIIPEDRRAEEEQVLARLRRGEKIDHFDTVRQTKDGRRVHISLTVSPIRDTTGRIVGASKVARDITDRISAQESRARLAAIVDSSDDAIVGITLDGVITSWNRGAEKIFGHSAAEAVGQPVFLIIPEDRRVEGEEVLARLRRGEQTEHSETERQTKDGRRLHVSLAVSPIKDAAGSIIGASKIARDITERIAAQEALQRAHDQLEERVRARTAELSRANDALRYEIAERQGIEQQRTQLFTRLVVAQEDERRRLARELHDQLGQQMTALRLTLESLKALPIDPAEFLRQVETLQQLARELDRDIAFRVWELRSVVLDRLGLAAALTEHAGSWSKRFGIHAQLSVDRPSDTRLPSEVETTIYRLAQEALNNVAKHARADRVELRLTYGDDYVALTIEDNGIGFDPSAVQRAPVGFGLIGMRERATLAGAEFQVESTRGKGTTVMVRVPTTAARTVVSA